MKNKLGKRSKQKINFICTWTTLAADRGSEWANRKKESNKKEIQSERD